MTYAAPVTDLIKERLTPFPRDHFLAAGDLHPPAALALLDLADAFVDFNRQSAKGVDLLSQKVGCAVVNAGDGRHEHPTQALLDLLSIRRAFGDVGGLTVAICGDIAHSRVARSNVALLQMMGARVRLIGPPTLVPGDADRWAARSSTT